jgi:hypothetical protein
VVSSQDGGGAELRPIHLPRSETVLTVLGFVLLPLGPLSLLFSGAGWLTALLVRRTVEPSGATELRRVQRLAAIAFTLGVGTSALLFSVRVTGG